MVSYNKLWKLLIDKNMTKTQLRTQAQIGTVPLAKMGKNEPVSMETLEKICAVLSCNFGDIIDYSDEDIKD